MNDDDDTGGGTIVIHPSPTGPAHAARTPFPASPPAQPLPADAGPMPTQVLPITELPSGPSAPLPAAGRPAEGGFRPAMTLPIPPHGASPSGAPGPQARFESQPPAGGHPGYPGEGGYPAPHAPPGYSADGARARPSGAPQAGPQGLQAPAPYDPRGSAANLPPPYPGHEPPRAQAAQRPMQLNDGPTEVTRKSGTGTVVLLLVFALLIGAGIAGTVFLLKRRPSEVEPQPTAGAEATATATATATAAVTAASLATAASATGEPALAPSGAASGSAPTTAVIGAPSETSAPPPSSAPPGKGPEGEALAALDKLRAAVEHCTKNGTHVLPGTSPPIPDSFAKLKRGPYTPVARDFDSAFFHCSLLRLEQPMSFVLQWQLDEPSWRGTGVVWIDSDGDGEIDKAYSFYAQLKQKDEIQFAPVQPLDPKKRPLIPR